MSRPDLNLLAVLDVLLTEGNVARAAQRLRLSPSAMSRSLARLRATTADPLLVRAGRRLVMTPRAAELRERVSQLVQESEDALRPAGKINLAQLVRSFTLRTGDGFVENFGPSLIARARREAPGVRLCFVQKPDKDSAPLREGILDLETGVIGKTMGPELRAQALFHDRFVGVVHKRHVLARGRLTAARYASGSHIGISRRESEFAPIAQALADEGLERNVVVTVGGFSSALALARDSDLIATVPERHTASLRAGLHSFALPVPTPGFTVSLFWHPRLDADPAHRWLRELVREVCGAHRK